MEEVILEVSLGGKVRTILFGEKAWGAFMSKIEGYMERDEIIYDFVYLGLDNDYYSRGENVDFTKDDVIKWINSMTPMEQYEFALMAVPKILKFVQSESNNNNSISSN